jgi:DNA-binding NtrC family response regulator
VAAGPFVAVNCGAIGHELMASELFGHRKGAFTGAHDHRKGAFESAHGGTLFLDEIGELPLDVQPALLRATESGAIRPLGSDVERHVRVRLLAATNRDLPTEVENGRFREDLFYRLAVVKLAVPPLRERVADIPLLAREFAVQSNLPGLPDDIVQQLCQRSWPGNARELRNAIQAYAVLGILPDVQAPRGGGDRMEIALSELVSTSSSYADQKDALIDRFTKIYLRRLMVDAKENQSEAARMAKLDRAYLRKLLAKYGLI